MNPSLKKRSSTRYESSLSPTSRLVISYLISLGISMAVGALLLAVSALISLSAKDPDKLLMPLAVVSLYVSTLIGGIVAASRSSEPICASLIHGAAVLAAYAFLSIFDYSKSDIMLSVLPSILLHAMIPVSSLLGGLIVLKKASRRSRQRHR